MEINLEIPNLKNILNKLIENFKEDLELYKSNINHYF